MANIANMIIAREKELEKLRAAAMSDRSEFIAVYGRRRIGKTYLIREAFDYKFTFQHAGIANKPKNQQLFAFCASLKDAGLKDFEEPTNWLEAFELLKDLIRNSRKKKKLLPQRKRKRKKRLRRMQRRKQLSPLETPSSEPSGVR